MIASTSAKIQVEINGPVATLTINNPPANTWDVESLPALRDVVAALNDDLSVYALVITGSGDKFFSAGADLKLFADGDPATARTMGQHFGEAFEALSNFRGVSIAAINGFALGGGLELAMAAHVRVASSNARMGLPEVSLGVIPGYGGTQRLAQIVGKGKAMEMVLTGGMIDAEAALACGLVNQVVDQELSLETAHALAAKMAKNAPTALAAPVVDGMMLMAAARAR